MSDWRFLFPSVALLLVAAIRTSFGTEFGAVADLPYPAQTIESKLLPEWRRGELKWVRASSPVLMRHGFNQVAVVHWAPASSRAAGGLDLPDDLLALYWHCRTNYPTYPSVRQAWEVWNEPDFRFVRDTPDRMAAVMKAAYWGLKAANPNATVLMPSLAFTPDKYQAELWRNGAFAYTEGYNFHFYGWAQDFLGTVVQHQRFLDDNGLHLPLWVTEAGYFSLPQNEATNPVELARQRTFHERLTVTAQAAGVSVYLPFILTPYTEADFDLSLVRNDLSPRPALLSYLRLSHDLPQWRPLFSIWHRPSKSEVGEVFQRPDGLWETVLWTPFRWKDVVLPQADGTAEVRDPHEHGADRTALLLHARFSKSDQAIQIDGVPSPLGEQAPPRSLVAGLELELSVSSTNNVFLRTPPERFDIAECDWRPAGRSSTPSSARPTAPSSPTLSRPTPSSVILQLTYDPAQVRADKPSQSYLFDPTRPVDATLHVYNLSENEQRGTWNLELPDNWMVTITKPAGSAAGSAEPEFVRLPPIGTTPAASAECILPPLGQKELHLRLVPPAEESTTSGHALARALIECRWTGANGASDPCATWLQPRSSFLVPNLPFSSDRWLPTPGPTNEWDIVPLESGEVHLVVQQPPASDQFASMWCLLPKDLELRPDDILCAEIRTASARPITYRLNLLTPQKESFRYTEDQRLGAGWNRLNWRIGDFGSTFWSELGPDYKLPAAKLRYLRLSFDHLTSGDFIELRNVGIWRADLSSSQRDRPRR